LRRCEGIAFCRDLVSAPEAFSPAVQLRFNTGLPEQQRSARNRLDRESWLEKAAAFQNYIGAWS
jgi:hypothetical protein